MSGGSCCGLCRTRARVDRGNGRHQRTAAAAEGELRTGSPYDRGCRSWYSRRCKNRKAAREGYDPSIDLKECPKAESRSESIPEALRPHDAEAYRSQLSGLAAYHGTRGPLEN